MIIAETTRLLIAKMTLADAPFILELVNTPHWIKYIGDRNVKTVEEAEIYLKNGILKGYETTGFGFYKLLLKDEGNRAIGLAGLVKREQLDDLDIGFAMLPDYEGRGFGLESSLEIMTFAEHHLKLKKIVAIVTPANKNSIKLLEKLGLTYEKTVNPYNEDEDLLLYSKTFKNDECSN